MTLVDWVLGLELVAFVLVAVLVSLADGEEWTAPEPKRTVVGPHLKRTILSPGARRSVSSDSGRSALSTLEG